MTELRALGAEIDNALHREMVRAQVLLMHALVLAIGDLLEAEGKNRVHAPESVSLYLARAQSELA